MLPTSKEEARRLGLRRYFTGRPCKRGHLSARDMNGRCLECRSIVDVAIRRRHYLKHHEKIRAKGRRRYANLSPELKKASQDRWTRQRQHYAKQNPERERQRHKKYYDKNKERWASYVHARRARQHQAGGRYTPADILKIRIAQGDRCAICRKCLYDRGEIDHVIPLALGGSNDPSNLELLCMPCNRFKSDKPLSQLLREIEDQLDLSSLDWDNIHLIQQEPDDAASF